MRRRLSSPSESRAPRGSTQEPGVWRGRRRGRLGRARPGGAKRPPAPVGLPCAVVRVVFTGSGAFGAEGSQRRVRRPSDVDLGMDVERRLVVPDLKHDQLVGVQGALKDLKLLTAGFLLYGAAAVGHGLGECSPLPRFGVRGG